MPFHDENDLELAATNTVPAPESSYSPDVLDLSKQLRNMLLLQPIFKLNADKNRLRGEDGGSIGMEKLDVYFLSLSLLDFMMEGMALSGGRGSQEVVAHLIQLIEKMDPSLSKEKAEHCSERVFDAILNRDESFKDFSFEYFHFPSASFRRFSFRLVRFSQEDGGSYLYKPTEEGYLVYLGMLDLSPEIGAELMEKMLDLLVTRGKYREAIDIARRARTLSIEFRQLIGDSVGRAKRAPSSVKWSKTMTPKLDEARLHVEKRRREDERMIGSIDQSIEASKEASKKKELYVLREILDSSSLVRAKLLGEIVAAPEEFLAAQNFLFRPRGKIGLPDLEETLFPALLDLTLIELSESVDSIISALYKPQFPEVLDFNSLLYSVFAKKRQAAVPEFDDGEVLVVEPPPPKFSVEIIEHVQNWAAATLKRLGKLDISEFLELGGRELSSEIELKCLVMVLFRSFAPSESVLGACTARVTGKRFRTRFVEGSMLELFAEVENGSNSQHSI